MSFAFGSSITNSREFLQIMITFIHSMSTYFYFLRGW